MGALWPGCYSNECLVQNFEQQKHTSQKNHKLQCTHFLSTFLLWCSWTHFVFSRDMNAKVIFLDPSLIFVNNHPLEISKMQSCSINIYSLSVSDFVNRITIKNVFQFVYQLCCARTLRAHPKITIGRCFSTNYTIQIVMITFYGVWQINCQIFNI